MAVSARSNRSQHLGGSLLSGPRRFIAILLSSVLAIGMLSARPMAAFAEDTYSISGAVAGIDEESGYVESTLRLYSEDDH